MRVWHCIYDAVSVNSDIRFENGVLTSFAACRVNQQCQRSHVQVVDEFAAASSLLP